MAEADDYEEDLFADVYDQDEAPAKAPEPMLSSAPIPPPAPVAEPEVAHSPPQTGANGGALYGDQESRMEYGTPDTTQPQEYTRHAVEEENYGPIGIKEDG